MASQRPRTTQRRGTIDIKHLRPNPRGHPKRTKVSFHRCRKIRWLAFPARLTPHSAGDNKRFAALTKKRRTNTNTGADEVTSISYLPATFTTLFFLAAGLLLGYLQ